MYSTSVVKVVLGHPSVAGPSDALTRSCLSAVLLCLGCWNFLNGKSAIEFHVIHSLLFIPPSVLLSIVLWRKRFREVEEKTIKLCNVESRARTWRVREVVALLRQSELQTRRWTIVAMDFFSFFYL